GFFGFPIAICAALERTSPLIYIWDWRPICCLRRGNYKTEDNFEKYHNYAQRSGSAAGRAADRPLQPVVRRPCDFGAAEQHAWPSPKLQIQRTRIPDTANLPLRTVALRCLAGPVRWQCAFRQ